MGTCEFVTNISQLGDATVIALYGELDVAASQGLSDELAELIDSGTTDLIIDLTKLAFIDSTGLGVLIGTARRADERGGSLHAVCSQPQPRKLLWMTGVDRRIPLSATVDEALMLQATPRGTSG